MNHAKQNSCRYAVRVNASSLRAIFKNVLPVPLWAHTLTRICIFFYFLCPFTS